MSAQADAIRTPKGGEAGWVRRRVEGLGASVIDTARAARLLYSIFIRTLYYSVRGRREKGAVLRACYHIGNRSLFFLTAVMGFVGMIMVFHSCTQINRITGDLPRVEEQGRRGVRGQRSVGDGAGEADEGLLQRLRVEHRVEIMHAVEQRDRPIAAFGERRTGRDGDRAGKVDGQCGAVHGGRHGGDVHRPRLGLPGGPEVPRRRASEEADRLRPAGPGRSIRRPAAECLFRVHEASPALASPALDSLAGSSTARSRA